MPGGACFRLSAWQIPIGILTIYAYGATDSVEYSLDGEHWQSEPVFVLQNDSLPPQGWVRVEGCDTLRFYNQRRYNIGNCVLYSISELNTFYVAQSPQELRISPLPIYRLSVMPTDIWSIVPLASLHPCMQDLSIGLWPDSMQVEAIPFLLERWPSLTYLNAFSLGDGEQSIRMLREVSNLVQLKGLGLSYYRKDTLPESIGNMTQLESFVISSFQNDNWLETFPESFGNLTNLKYIYIGGPGDGIDSPGLNRLPESFGNLTNLEKITFDIWYMESLPESFGNLRSLKTFIFSNNGASLSKLPPSFENLTNLRTLDLSYIGMDTISPYICRLPNLQSLTISRWDDNIVVPDEIANLADTLQTLNLSYNTYSPAEQARIRALLPMRRPSPVLTPDARSSFARPRICFEGKKHSTRRPVRLVQVKKLILMIKRNMRKHNTSYIALLKCIAK